MAALPTGTVTFLFTDIEGSTKLWEEYTEEMRAALSRHDDLLRATITQHRGHIFKTVGMRSTRRFRRRRMHWLLPWRRSGRWPPNPG